MASGVSFVAELSRHIGQTVTIFTTSGGQSGSGFTGVLVAVNKCFVRLITQIGSAPGCALGNCCNPHGGPGCGQGYTQGFEGGAGFAESAQLGGPGRASCNPVTLGSVVDIPVDRIASFVRNSIGGGW